MSADAKLIDELRTAAREYPAVLRLLSFAAMVSNLDSAFWSGKDPDAEELCAAIEAAEYMAQADQERAQ